MEREDALRVRIIYLRSKLGVSAREMSLSIGQSDNYINKIENGKALPSIDALFRICDYFEMTLEEFFAYENMNPRLTSQLAREVNGLHPRLQEHLLEIVRALKRNRW